MQYSEKGEGCQCTKGYVRSRAVDAKAVSDMLVDADSQPVLQPGQRTVWDING